MLKIKSQIYNEKGINDWGQISTQLQMHELPDDKIPRLLMEAIQEIFHLQGQLKSLKNAIQELWHNTEKSQ